MGRVLGLTGGIATGKSTVVNIFHQFGFPIVDADKIARQVVEPGTPGLMDIVTFFGPDILTDEGTLNRKKLGTIIFEDEQKRTILNQLLSKYIQTAILKEIEKKQGTSSLVVVDIPLLFEGGYEVYMDQVAVVYIPESLQVQRLMERDHLTEQAALQRIHSQWPIETKKKLADVIFDNQKNRAQTKIIINDWLAAQGLIDSNSF